jgi:TPR repeat protein
MPAATAPSVPEAFLCPISHEVMSDPVVAADGHSYDKSEIEKWFATGNRSSPMTNSAMPSTTLRPNLLVRSQIREWQARSSAQQVADIITAIVMTPRSDTKVVEGKLLELARFVESHNVVVHPETLQMLSSMLQGSAQLWVAPVQQGLQAVEAECKLVVAALAAQLRDERRDEGLAAAAATAAVGKLAQLDIEVAAAEEALGKLKQKRAKQAKKVAALQQLERDCGSSATQVETELGGYPEPMALLEEGDEGKGVGATTTRQSKRKRADDEQPGTVVAKRQRGGDDSAAGDLDYEVLLQEGLERSRGSHARLVDKVRGRLLIEAAAAHGVMPLAVAYCRMDDEYDGYADAYGEQVTVVDELRALASAGGGATSWIALEAQYLLGLCCDNGFGIETDAAEAVKWYRKAAAQGHSGAQYNLGNCYYSGVGVEKDQAVAVGWYRKAAAQGHRDAQNSLGCCYYSGVGVEKDQAVAVGWYRKAAAQGHSEAQNSLGCCYYNGDGVEKDEAVAVGWYRNAAAQGLSEAQDSLGNCYLTGKGVEKDQAVAVEWYRKAAAQGHRDAQNSLGNCYYNGDGVEKDQAVAVGWYRKAAERGHTFAQLNLGECYEDGEGVEQDEVEAVKWYRKAAEQGDTDAQRALGRCYREGIGVEEDRAEASRWHELADADSDADDG